MEKALKIHRAKGDIIFDTILFIILTLILIIVAYPLYFVIISSFSEPNAVASGQVVWYPVGFSLEGYTAVFEDDRVVRGFINAVIYTVCGTLLSLAVTLPTAYALSRSDFNGNRFVTIFYLITMFVSGGMIPTYLVVRGLHMLDTMWALIVPGCLAVSNRIGARTFFKNTPPDELLEAAKLDGCSNGRFFFNIALPLSGAIIAILVLYYGQGLWNNYFNAMLYLSTQEKWPLQLVLRSILILNDSQLTQVATTPEQIRAIEEARQRSELMKYSLIIISSIPMMVIYPLVQKHFVKGVMIGSVKG